MRRAELKQALGEALEQHAPPNVGHRRVEAMADAALAVVADLVGLEHVEFGYDREYTGVALHCRLCPPDDYGRTALIVEQYDGDPLDVAVAVAAAHVRTAHL